MLTSKQEKFCLNIVKGMTKYDSYIDAYDAENMQDATIYAKASSMCKEDKISIRIRELKEPIEKAIREELKYTALESFKKLNEIQEMALAEEKKEYNSAIKAEDLKGKLANLYTIQTKELNPTQIVVNSDKDKEALDNIKPRGK